VDRARHRAILGREDQRGAVGVEQGAALERHRLRHGQDEAVALHRAHERQADAGVAAGGLDDDALAGADLAVALGGLDHRQGDAILDAAARVVLLALGPHLGGVGRDDAGELDERRPADEGGERVEGGGANQMKYSGGWEAAPTPSSPARRTRSPNVTPSNQAPTWSWSSRQSEAVTRPPGEPASCSMSTSTEPCRARTTSPRR